MLEKLYEVIKFIFEFKFYYRCSMFYYYIIYRVILLHTTLNAQLIFGVYYYFNDFD